MTATCTEQQAWALEGHIEESGPLRQFPIDRVPFTIGRKTGLSLTLPCLSVSKMHAELLGQETTLLARDLNSTNGTYVNGIRVREAQPLRDGDLLQFGNIVFSVNSNAGEPAARETMPTDACERAFVLLQFDKLMNRRAVVPFFQPIVRVADEQIVGYEVLGRSRLFGIYTPQSMFQVAAQLGMETELSRLLRAVGVQEGSRLQGRPPLFLNTHPLEIQGPELLASLRELREAEPDLPLVLEIHESAVTDTATLVQLRSELRALNCSLAFDDFGAGQSRLTELADVAPDYLKFDLQLVRGIHLASAQRQQLLARLVHMSQELGVTSVAEGVETDGELETCRQMSFDLAQGFRYGKPQPRQSIEREQQARALEQAAEQ